MDLVEFANARLSKSRSFLSFPCHTFRQTNSPKPLRIFKNALNMVSGYLWTLPPDFLGPYFEVLGSISWVPNLKARRIRDNLCHTFRQSGSRRWVRIFKNALNMVLGCLWTLPPDFLGPKYQLSDAVSRNLAFEFQDISSIVTLYEQDGLKTRSGILWLFATGQQLDIAQLSIK